MGTHEIGKEFEPGKIEEKWYDYWERNGLFHADPRSSSPPFSMVIPPPNVTGSLHMGHALNNTLQDILCRYKRMKGYNVLWQPGTDHAGIATQNVVEKDLAQRGEQRHKIGRERFVELVWKWQTKYGGVILNQLKKLGCSCDWSRERFTLDEGLSRAVREVFIHLYEEGLIYRGDYIINWCPRCQTAIADIEVEHEDKEDHLYHIRYPFENRDGHLVVATTRPETLMGDTAVAVNPEDPRYKGLAGLKVLLPVINRPIPVILDRYVDMEFGTGALKITPAHDPWDFDIGNAHQLERIKVIDEAARMNNLAGPYQGLDRFECREAILQDLEKGGWLENVEPYMHAVGHCYRCKTMIEPLLSKQWFVKTAPLAKKAAQATKNGRTRIYPATWERVYFDWLDNIRDWCISRQIWWGHRIPAWYCRSCEELYVGREEPKKCSKCGAQEFQQDTDVLDTWFSSALWPFSTLGWPEESEELKVFYPTSVLVTGFDILFFWVARMMIMGLHFMGDVPFRKVYIHALVRDAEGKKMSKSKGNVIDPLEVMSRFGTDAFRFTLAILAVQGRDIKLSEERIQGYRHFVNKIWNAARLILHNLDSEGKADPTEYTLPDRWILTRVGQVSREVTEALEEFRFNEAAGISYQFVWHEFCDWYLEMAKQGFYGDDQALRTSSTAVAKEVLRAVLKLLHPFMPFVTEEVWQRIPGSKSSIMTSSYPEAEDYIEDQKVLKEMELLTGIITSIRNVRGEMGMSPSMKVSVVLDMPDDEERKVVENNFRYIKSLAKVSDVSMTSESVKPKGSATAVFGGNQIHVLLKGVLDFEKERERITKEIQKIEKDMVVAEKKLANEEFLNKAPEDVVRKVRDKAESLQNKHTKLTSSLRLFEEADEG